MIDIKKVLVNIDLTPTAIKAVEWGKTIAQLAGAELILYYDMEELEAVGDYANLFAFPIDPDLEEKTKEKVKKAFFRYLEDFKGNYKYEFICCGKKKLAEYIEENQVDLAVLNEKYLSIVSQLPCQVLITK